MDRDYWVLKLGGMIERMEAGLSPARVREIYVFGSFARGAIDPGDLDLIVIRDPPTKAQLAP